METKVVDGCVSSQRLEIVIVPIKISKYEVMKVKILFFERIFVIRQLVPL